MCIRRSYSAAFPSVKRAGDSKKDPIEEDTKKCYFNHMVWVFRAMLSSFIEPWPLEPVPAAAIGQLIVSDILALLMVIVTVTLCKKQKANACVFLRVDGRYHPAWHRTIKDELSQPIKLLFHAGILPCLHSSYACFAVFSWNCETTALKGKNNSH